jgi:5-methylcytosine-specific restriction protein A
MFPNLIKSDRSRETKKYSVEQVDLVIYRYLTETETSHRKLDEDILKQDNTYSRGYESMSILHHVGLVDAHKGFFDTDIENMINQLESQDSTEFAEIILSLKRFSGKAYTEVYSWIQISDSVILKVIDKSAIDYNGTGIPKELRKFFGIDKIKYQEPIEIRLEHNDFLYNAHFLIEKSDLGRTRLFWSSDFTHMMLQTLNLYVDIDTIDKSLRPRIRFQILNPHKYRVSFIQPDQILKDIADDYVPNTNSETYSSLSEGQKQYMQSVRYERNPTNRKRAIELHGLICNICGFDFGKEYGVAGAGYIEVHHITPLHTVAEGININPYTDLITVCSNCHRVIHRDRDNVLTIDYMRSLIGTP